MPSARLKWHTSTVGTLRGKFQKIFGKVTHIGMLPIPREGGREGLRGVTVLWLNKLSNIFTINHTPRLFCKAQRKPLNHIRLRLCMLLKMFIFADTKPIETAVREIPSNMHGILRLTHCPPVRLQNSKQPRISSSMKQSNHITRNISTYPHGKHLIEWE